MKPQPDTFDSSETRLHLIVEKMEGFHKEQEALCDRLEHLADHLPGSFNAQEALCLARQIMPLICEAHRFEETIIFDQIADDNKANQSLERLKFEHWEDEASGEDLTDALLAYAKEPRSDAVDKLSYMLRGFFDNLRRHIAFEAEHILPVIKQKAVA